MVAPGPESSINREYYAQNHESDMIEGKYDTGAYDKTDEKARDLLRRLANSEPYYKKQRRLEAEQEESGEKPAEQKQIGYGPGPVRTSDAKRGSPAARSGRGGSRGGRPFPSTAALPPQLEDILPPRDPNITSLFVTGVEDDLPEHAIRTFFTPFGQIRSLVCSHRSHCAFINYATREGAEAAAEHCQGRAVVKGCPLRVKWGKPKPLDSTDREQRMEWAREGRQTAEAVKAAQSGQGAITTGESSGQGAAEEEEPSIVLVAPPGAEKSEVQYASLAGD
jgi:pre-mRNA-splicing factor RBM22/SLT11